MGGNGSPIVKITELLLWLPHKTLESRAGARNLK